ncbi:hypothetical protein MOQ_001802 [Trypanosoma cruzi marinkellei]|uniref:SUN domain-containing protein n=1 Tax=Trypanosoma cruzi marinkellei TaxID=85056 RepID=K2NJS8_TRYCR|nr:hypothetical protein MOQ_001802 [Trypanosoma cruzi marinkellei]
MKTDRLITLIVLALMAVTCGFLLLNARKRGGREENPPWKSSSFTTNYASAYLGATLTDFSRACKGASSVLNEDKTKYMICNCEASRKLFTVQLIREIEVRSVMLVNLEHFSSGVKKFMLLGSKKYPTSEWRVLGEFEASPWRGTQHFDVLTQEPVRFLRFLWVTSHSDDSWCTLTVFKVFGVDVLETLTEDYGGDLDNLLYSLPDKALPAPAVVVMPSPPFFAEVDARADKTATWFHPLKEKEKLQGGAVLEKLFQEVDAIIAVGANHSGSGGTDDLCTDGRSSSCCDHDELVDNNSTTCTLHEKEPQLPRSRCKCFSRANLSSRMALSPRPFQGGAALQIITQMSKHLKALQQELEESFARQRDTERRLEKAEMALGNLGTHFRDALRLSCNYRERLIDMKKEMDVMNSRLLLAMESINQKGGDVSFRMWVVCSNVVAFIAFFASCFAPHSRISRRARRFTQRG